MINLKALYHITYGLYIVSSGNTKNGNGYISNTVFQITSSPAKFAISCNKDNYTSELIQKFKTFSVSVLHRNTKPETFGTFGFKTGKTFNKLKGMNIKSGKTGTLIILDDSIAYLEFKLTETIDEGTHLLFIGELVDAQIIDKNLEPITYAYYRNLKKGVAPKNAPTYIEQKEIKKPDSKIYKCSVCGHIYDDSIEDVKFENLPDNWICPTCGVTKENFIEL